MLHVQSEQGLNGKQADNAIQHMHSAGSGGGHPKGVRMVFGHITKVAAVQAAVLSACKVYSGVVM